VLVTGAAGLIGRASLRLLEERGHELLASDLRPPPPALDHLPWQRLDIRRGEQLQKGCAAFAPDVVVHLAARHFIPWCERHPAATLTTNVVGTQNVIAAARASSIGKLLFASSAAVYAPSRLPLDEDTPLGPDDIYGTSKVMGEQLVRLAGRDAGTRRDAVAGRDAGMGLDTVTLRLFNTIGPDDANAHLIPRLLGELRRGGRPRLGNLDSVRDYIHVEDVARAIVAAVERQLPGSTVLNVGSGVGHSVGAVVDACGELLGRALDVVSVPTQRRAVDRPYLVANIERTRELLSWEPAVPFKRGLADVLRCAGIEPQPDDTAIGAPAAAMSAPAAATSELVAA
jgi:UDP-glucose 4-epimerase